MGLTVSSNRRNRFIPWIGALSGLGLLTILGSAPRAIAQPIPVPPPMQSAPTAQQFLFVNPSSGDDAGQGMTQRSPFRTLTRALQAVQPNSASNTIIMLAAGTYTPDTGEVFPLVMPPGVMIQGDPSTKGESIVIKGGGSFATATTGRQNVAIVGTGQIVGVTVSNPNLNGYGVWIEGGSPVIANNTFTGSNLAGVAIMGNSTPSLWGNTFSHNRAGIIVAATAQPVIKDSLDQVGAATLAASVVSTAPAAPRGSTPPRVSTPRVSTPRVPAPVSTAPRVSAAPTERLSLPPSAPIAQATPTSNPPRPQLRQQPPATLIQTLPAQSTASPPRRTRTTVARRSRAVRPAAVNIPVPPPQAAAPRRDLPISSSTPIPVPPPEVSAASSSFTAPPSSSVPSNLLQVPAEPPIGNVGDMPVFNVSRNPLQYRESSSKQTAASRGLRYRVIVAAGRRADRVRSLFPGAFTTYSGGEAVLQVGAFGDRTNAEEAAQVLNSNGLNGTIEALDN